MPERMTPSVDATTSACASSSEKSNRGLWDKWGRKAPFLLIRLPKPRFEFHGDSRRSNSGVVWLSSSASLHRHTASAPQPTARNALKTLLLLLLISGPALANDAGLLKCGGIADATARLTCYDALMLSATKSKAGPHELRQTPEQFGIPEPTYKVALDTIESHIPGDFEGWGPKATISLANGQVWQIRDDSSYTQYTRNPKVIIRRGVLGAFYLEVEGANSSPRVKRLR